MLAPGRVTGRNALAAVRAMPPAVGGAIVDGSGAPGYRGDVGLRGGGIAALGDAKGGAAATIEAEGRVVCPGFVDTPMTRTPKEAEEGRLNLLIGGDEATVAEAVARAAQATGVAQIGPQDMPPEKVHERTERYIYEGELAWLPQEGQDYGKLSINEEALELHRRYQGCIQVYAKVPDKAQDELELFEIFVAVKPGVSLAP